MGCLYHHLVTQGQGKGLVCMVSESNKVLVVVT
jgi:hypothetical protein